jgi:hypothetical protein
VCAPHSDVSGRGFEGQLPLTVSWWSAFPALENFDASNNKLAGALPAAVASCPSLRVFSVSNNDLSGALPSWSGMPNLQAIKAANNRFTGAAEGRRSGLGFRVNRFTDSQVWQRAAAAAAAGAALQPVGSPGRPCSAATQQGKGRPM